MPENLAWEDTLRLLASRPVTGLLAVAVRDPSKPDSPAQLVDDVYLELERGNLHLKSVNNFGGLQVRYLDAIDLRPIIEVFEPEEVFTVRLDPFFLGESHEVLCLEVNYVTNEESDLELGIVRCAEFVFSQGHRVFFDPMWTSGVRVGNTNPWTREWRDGPWAFQRHRWTRS
jgi:hypothetical protein